MKKPLCIDLFCGLGGWSEGFLAAGYDVVGFDNHRHVYGTSKYPGQLVIQDVLTLHGSQFSNAAVIVASPPCQAYSYMAMPWSLAKPKAAAIRADETGVKLKELNALFDACFRIQREAIEASTCPACFGCGLIPLTKDPCRYCEGSGKRYIPLIVENVKGAQPWVGRAPWNFGSFYLWGDVPALMPVARGRKNGGGSWFAIGSPGQTNVGQNPDGRKVPGMNAKTGKPGRSFQSAAVEGTKNGNDWFGSGADCSLQRKASSGSSARKMASAQIAKIPFALAEHIARVFHPGNVVDFDTERSERAG